MTWVMRVCDLAAFAAAAAIVIPEIYYEIAKLIARFRRPDGDPGC